MDTLTGGAIVDLRTGKSWSRADFKAAVSRRHHALSNLGIKKGDLVLIAHGNSPEAIADIFAVWSIGAAAATLNPGLTLPELTNLETFCNPAAILVGEGFGFEAEQFKSQIINLAGSPPVKELSAPVPLAPDDPALILFTSGTTGTPKGVVHTRASLEAKISANVSIVSAGSYERSLCVLSSHFVAGLVANILSPLAVGKTVYLFPTPGIKGAGEIGKLVDEHQITMTNTVPSFWHMVLKASPKPKGNSLDFIGVASAPLDQQTWQGVIDWAGTDNVWNMYGTTETGGWNIGISGQDILPRKGLIGKPLLTDVAVRLSPGEISNEGEGEIVMRGPSLMRGYFREKGLTEAAFDGEWFRTGDLGRIDPDGLVSIIGRLNSVINRAGIKVVPEEVEALLARHENVKDVCVFSLPDVVSGETVAAAIVLRGQGEISSETLREWCKTRIRQECVPEKWFQIDKIERTANGKINRIATRDICLAKNT